MTKSYKLVKKRHKIVNLSDKKLQTSVKKDIKMLIQVTKCHKLV